VKNIRRWHLYLSVFFAPMLIFYIGTGWYQTLNQNRNKSLGEAEDVVSKLASVHVDQVYPAEGVKSFKTGPFKVLVVIMSICLLVTIGLGIYLAFRSLRVKWPVWVSLLLGVILPMLLLWLGQRR
jgi:hypothetical protein